MHNNFKYSFGVIKSEINQHIPLTSIGYLISKGKLFPTETILKELNVNYKDIVQNLRALT